MFERLRLHYVHWKTVRAYASGDWRKIPIRDNGELLVEVPPECCYPYYARQMHLVSDERVFLRQDVCDRYLRARDNLRRKGFDLIVYDGWRSIELQENLFWYYMREFTAARFGRQAEFAGMDFAQVKSRFESLSPDVRTTLRDANRTYVSWPSKDPAAPSPHATGGSIDVWLYQNGQPASLGVPFVWMEENAGAFYHLRWSRPNFPGDARVSCNRSTLLFAMLDAGFTCYPPEIWHFNYGNQMDSLVRGGVARYSYIEPT